MSILLYIFNDYISKNTSRGVKLLRKFYETSIPPDEKLRLTLILDYNYERLLINIYKCEDIVYNIYSIDINYKTLAII